MNADLRATKTILRNFLQRRYTDERLTMLLDHARAGRLRYNSCCCFVGVVTARHRLQSAGIAGDHGVYFCEIPLGQETSDAYFDLGYRSPYHYTEKTRIRRIIPMILAEIRRRSRLNDSQEKYLSHELQGQRH